MSSTKLLNKLVNICSNLDSGTTSSGSSDSSTGWTTSTSSPTVSKTVNEVAVVPLMKLNDNQGNSFEGIITATYTKTSRESYSFTAYPKIDACGQFIINPIICITSRFDNELATDTLKVKRITVDSEVLFNGELSTRIKKLYL